MSERKTISINPELFSLSGNTTRKKRPSKENKDLKIKSTTPKQPQSNKTLRNRLLHYIRKNQEENFKKMHGSKPEITVPDRKYTSAITDSFNNDFEESLKYMTEIADQVTHKLDNDYIINQTLRNYKSLNPESILSGGGDFDKAVEGLSGGDLPVYTDLPPVNMMESVKLTPAQNPQWGCMKGGSLPTYRLWKNQTQRARDPMDSITPPAASLQIPAPQINLGNMSMSSIGSIAGGAPLSSIHTQPEPAKPIFDSPRLSQLKQTMEKVKASNAAEEKNKIKYGKRKKTIRRTYKLGKSRITPKVSVLISNKTVRKNISTKTEKLKQIPIDEIRSVLIKKGFIKVGSLATNDVLRKMYESMLLVCGEVENHNPDNMLYNYFNA
uniref:Uncharacterized protein n=1 Tax=viral metagenome TaxID=1070528 RepID=A0A6C0HHU9_9ZZZZ